MTIKFESAESCACSYDLAEFIANSAKSVVKIVDVSEQEVRDLLMTALHNKKLTLRNVAYAISTEESGVVVTVYSAVAAILLTVEQLRPGVINSWTRKKGAYAPFYFVRHPNFIGLKNAFFPPCLSYR